TPPLGGHHRASLPKGAAHGLHTLGLAPSFDGCERARFSHVHSLESEFAQENAGARTQQPSLARNARGDMPCAATNRSSRAARGVRTITIRELACTTRYP